MEGVYVARQVSGRRDVVGTARRLADDAIRRHLGDAPPAVTTPDGPALVGAAPRT